MRVRGVRSWVFAAGLLASGCAPLGSQVQAPTPIALSAGLQRGSGRDIVIVAPFVDRREDKCGIVTNGFRWNVHRSRCSDPPGELYAALIGEALSAAGYHVTNDLAAAAPSTLIVSGAVERTLVEPTFRFFSSAAEADIWIRIGLSTVSGLRATRSFYIKGTKFFFADANSAAGRAFDTAVRETVVDIAGAIENFDEASR
jgi:hypothetical protein